jgi:hypothetical protein
MLETAELTESTSPGFQFHIGNVYIELKRLEDAERAYLRGLEFDECHANCWMGLCRTYLDMNKTKKALEAGTRAVGLKYQFPLGHYFLGIAKVRTNDAQGAADEFHVALSQNPNFAEAHDKLALLYTTTQLNEELAREHRAAARELREQQSEAEQTHAPIELPPLENVNFDEHFPALEEEQPKNFLPCLGQPKTSKVSDNGKAPQVTIVSGLPRSGTSMMMQMLVAAGIPPFTDDLRTPDASNPKGYFESELVKKIAMENDFILSCDGHVVKVVVQLLPYLPQAAEYRVIYMDRDIDEVMESQDKMLERMNMGGGKLENERLAEIFHQQVGFSLNLLKLYKIPYLQVSYQETIEDPKLTAERVAGFLQQELDINAMASSVDPALYRQRTTASN